MIKIGSEQRLRMAYRAEVGSRATGGASEADLAGREILAARKHHVARSVLVKCTQGIEQLVHSQSPPTSKATPNLFPEFWHMETVLRFRPWALALLGGSQYRWHPQAEVILGMDLTA